MFFQFHLKNLIMLYITDLPDDEHGYCEQDIVDVFKPFGLANFDDCVYIIPQTKMVRLALLRGSRKVSLGKLSGLVTKHPHLSGICSTEDSLSYATRHDVQRRWNICCQGLQTAVDCASHAQKHPHVAGMQTQTKSRNVGDLTRRSPDVCVFRLTSTSG